MRRAGSVSRQCQANDFNQSRTGCGTLTGWRVAGSTATQTISRSATATPSEVMVIAKLSEVAPMRVTDTFKRAMSSSRRPRWKVQPDLRTK
jgi:hypothetical protein